MNGAAEYRYIRLTWAEMKDAIAAQKLVILPCQVGGLERIRSSS